MEESCSLHGESTPAHKLKSIPEGLGDESHTVRDAHAASLSRTKVQESSTREVLNPKDLLVADSQTGVTPQDNYTTPSSYHYVVGVNRRARAVRYAYYRLLGRTSYHKPDGEHDLVETLWPAFHTQLGLCEESDRDICGASCVNPRGRKFDRKVHFLHLGRH